MKIGIITFHDSLNCGSMLQAYALQNTIFEKVGTNCEIIDYSSPEQQRIYGALKKPRCLKDILRNAFNILFLRQINKHIKDYREFSYQYLIKTKRKYDRLKDIQQNEELFDVLIAGSDQVWNVNAADCDSTYFLPGIKCDKKIAYAVSLGATDISCHKNADTYSTYINDFDAISVREKNAQRWVGKLYKRGEVDLTLDPTLLLNASQYSAIEGENIIKGEYIFWYTMVYKADVKKIVLNISKKLHIPVYVIDPKEWSRRGLFLNGIKLAPNGGPAAFLALVKNASLVLTSSFHGSIFSYLYEKDFWYINIHDGQAKDDRAQCLLEQLGLEERYVKMTEFASLDIMRKIDYTKKKDISELRRYSIEFLYNSIDRL